MKKRRTLVISLLLIAAIALGVGYAAISGALIIDGKVVAKAQPFNVHFVAFAAGESSAELSNVPAISCDTALSTDSPAKTVMLNIRDMASVGDSVEATLTVKNENDTTMYVSVETILYGATAGAVTGTDPDKFTVTTTWGNTVKAIEPNATEDITLTVTMNSSCTDAYEGYFRVTLNGNSVNPTPVE